MVYLPCYCLLLTAALLGCVHGSPQIVSSPETVSVYVGQTAVLKCQVADLSGRLVIWTSVTHDFVIFEGNQILTSNVTKYSLINVPEGQIFSLQILHIEPSDQGFYSCSIEGTDQKITTRLDVVELPDEFVFEGYYLNMTDCCIEQNVSESCLPGCYPNKTDLSVFNASKLCGNIHDVKAISKCFTAGTNHDNCCLNNGVDDICIGFCHNVLPDSLTQEHYDICYTDRVLIGIFSCFETGFMYLPSEPTDVGALVVHGGLSQDIVIRWSEPKRNAHSVIGYKIMYRPITRGTFYTKIINDPSARQIRLTEQEDKIYSDMDYNIQVSAQSEHGISLGSTQIYVYIPSMTPSFNRTINICCIDRDVDQKCRDLLCHSKIWSHFNTEHVLDCIPYLNDIFTCLVDQRNHTICCDSYDVIPDCLPLCSGQPPPLNVSLIGCVNQMGIIEACVTQSFDTLLTPPYQVTIAVVESTSAIIRFNHMHLTPISSYLVGLKSGSEHNPFVYNITIQSTERVVYLKDLKPNTYYWVRLVSVNMDERSLPSETVTFLTYPDGYNDPVPVKVINRLHNMTECCRQSGMPDICWRGCEYRSNITSYYAQNLDECIDHIGTVLTCAADGRNHSQCCQSRGVQSACLQLCAYTEKGALGLQHLACVSDTASAIMCFQEGILTLPRHPDVIVTNVSKNSISITWQQPETSGLIDLYIITYGIFPSQNQMVNTTRTSYILQDLQPNTLYKISVTSVNSNGTSAPSPEISEYTLSDDFERPSTNQTVIVGQPFWQNISHCCNESVSRPCIDQCLNKQTASLQHTSCIKESHKMLACYGNGSDHTNCCKQRGLPAVCTPICKGHVLEADLNMATCMSYAHRDIILSCFLEKHDLIPDAPVNFEAKLINYDASVKLTWSTPEHCSDNCTYSVHYWMDDDRSKYISYDNITTTSTTVQVKVGASKYTFTVIAHNKYGSGAPSAWQTVYIAKYERSVVLYIMANKTWVEQGQEAILFCEHFLFSQGSVTSIEWIFNNRRKLDNANQQYLRINSVDSSKDEGMYTCTVSDYILSSSDSLFLQVKSTPVFSNAKVSPAKPRSNEDARIEAFFRGLPDSETWMKNGQILKNEMTKLTMNTYHDDGNGITSYRLVIYNVDETDYGFYSLNVSNAFGMAEYHANLTSPADTIPIVPVSKPTDLKKCCDVSGMTSLCQELCGFHVNISEVIADVKYISCLPYFSTYIKCGADGRDHTKCCHSHGVLPLCITFCGGVAPDNVFENPDFLSCVPETPAIFQCLQEGHLLLPFAPTNVTLSYTNGEIVVRWNKPHNSEGKVFHYNIYYNNSGSPVPRVVIVNEIITEYHIKNILPGIVYNVWITAGNENGNSLASSIVIIDTSGSTSSQITSGSSSSNSVAIGVGVTFGIIVLIAIILVILFFLYKARIIPVKGLNTVAFENPGSGNQGQVKLQGVDEQFNYGRLQEEGAPNAQNIQDSSSMGESTADSSFENPMYNVPQSDDSHGAATLPAESYS